MAFSGGTGTPDDPYLVSTATQLNDVRNYLTSSFKQTNDIDLSSYSNWVSIGNTYSSYFGGVYDGGNYKITGLTASATYDAGLFGYAIAENTNCELKNIVLQGVNITGAYSGALVGETSAKVTNCHASGSVTGKSYAGGLIGLAYDNYREDFPCIIYNCSSSCSVTSTGTYPNNLGGFIGGTGENVTIEECFCTGNVTANVTAAYNVGGFVGGVECIIKNCYSNGKVSSLAEERIKNIQAWTGNYTFADWYNFIGTDRVVGASGYVEGWTVGLEYAYHYWYSRGRYDGEVQEWRDRGSGDVVHARDTKEFMPQPSTVYTVTDDYTRGCYDGYTYIYVWFNGGDNSAMPSPLIPNVVYMQQIYNIGYNDGYNHLTYQETFTYPDWDTSNGTYKDVNNGDMIVKEMAPKDVDYSPAAGFCGYGYNLSSFTNCYCSGMIETPNVIEPGGFIGCIDTGGTITSCYYDVDVSGGSFLFGGNAETTTAMKTQATFINWDFNTIWRIDGVTNNGYPFLDLRAIGTVFVKVNGAWVPSTGVYVKTNGTWQASNSVYVKNNNIWN